MIRFIIALILTASLSALPAFAEEEHETLTFSLFTRGWPPFEMIVQDTYHGIAVDIFQEIVPTGVKGTIEPVTKSRTVLRAKKGPVYTRLEAFEWIPSDKYLWSNPVMRLNSIIISPAATPIAFEGLHSLEGKTIGCIRNYQYPVASPLFKSKKATRYDVNSDTVLLRMVKAGRVDCAIIDQRTFMWMIQNSDELTYEDYHIAAQPLSGVDLRFVFNKIPGWEKRLPEINERIATIQKDGTLQRILSKYQ